jgi:predicted SprT family Zn-dependent metalloprotease
MIYEAEIQERLTTLNQAAYDHWGYDFDLPALSWDLKGTVGGQAFLNQNKIRINLEALKKYTEKYIEQTIGHEFAHPKVMRSFDLFPDRCHEYDLTPARVVKKQFLYACHVCGKEFKLTAVRHNKIIKGTKYSHSADGGRLIYKGRVK